MKRRTRSAQFKRILSRVYPEMNGLSLEGFEHAIKETHCAKAQFLSRGPVVETFEGETVWEGEVLVFMLSGHPSATICYAWEVDGQVTAVLHTGPVDSPLAAVRAAIVQEHRERHRETE